MSLEGDENEATARLIALPQSVGRVPSSAESGGNPGTCVTGTALWVSGDANDRDGVSRRVGAHRNSPTLLGVATLNGPQKTAVVTGASQGIGAGVVEAFVERGFNVVATARNSRRTA